MDKLHSEDSIKVTGGWDKIIVLSLHVSNLLIYISAFYTCNLYTFTYISILLKLFVGCKTLVGLVETLTGP